MTKGSEAIGYWVVFESNTIPNKVRALLRAYIQEEATATAVHHGYNKGRHGLREVSRDVYETLLNHPTMGVKEIY
jgi:hypothetical protein